MSNRDLRIAVQFRLDELYKRHTYVFAGVHRFAEERDNWHLVVNEWADRSLPTRGDDCPYDGLIGRVTAVGAKRANRLELPTVNLWYNSPARESMPGVFPDFEAAGELIAEHLIGKGFRRIGVVANANSSATGIVAEAMQQAVRKAGCESFTTLLLNGYPEFDALTHGFAAWKDDQRAITEWIENIQPPIALYFDEVSIARRIIEFCYERGWRVPEDIAIISGWNEELICECPEPSLSSVEIPYEQIGYEAARILDQLIAEKRENKSLKKPTKPKSMLLPPVGVVARRSTDFHAVDDPLVRSALNYIDRNLHRRISVDDLAKATEVSRRTLAARFREHLNRSIADEILRLRLERVKRELVASKLPIQQIAREAGFGSPRTLNDAFRNAVGCTPREYRKQHSIN